MEHYVFKNFLSSIETFGLPFKNILNLVLLDTLTKNVTVAQF